MLKNSKLWLEPHEFNAGLDTRKLAFPTLRKGAMQYSPIPGFSRSSHFVAAFILTLLILVSTFATDQQENITSAVQFRQVIVDLKVPAYDMLRAESINYDRSRSNESFTREGIETGQALADATRAVQDKVCDSVPPGFFGVMGVGENSPSIAVALFFSDNVTLKRIKHQQFSHARKHNKWQNYPPNGPFQLLL